MNEIKKMFGFSNESRKNQVPQKGKIDSPMVVISYLSSHAKNATARDDLLSAYIKVKFLAEEALNQFEEYKSMAVQKKQKELKEGEHQNDEKIKGLEQAIKSNTETMQSLQVEGEKSQNPQMEVETRFRSVRSMHGESVKKLQEATEAKEQLQTQFNAAKDYESLLQSRQDEFSNKIQELTIAKQTIATLEQKIKNLTSEFTKEINTLKGVVIKKKNVKT